MKLGTIVFDDRVLDALRDDRLVVFAGAGVSMGPPSNLDSFSELAKKISWGTGRTPEGPLDRFLGQLHHRHVAVHERAAQFLSPEGSAPNELHHNLLRLFQTPDRIRLVTTNFDLHFETAAKAVFGDIPDVYRAPALPLGYNFSGIVHVHGALPQSQHLVLTDADFGRAYLTEGWARRFLVDLFRQYTVLFVGYSHDDVVMTYLARALPAEDVAGRFALTDEDGSWNLLGITPFHFEKGTGLEAFKELYDGIQRFADRAARGVLDWQSRLAELGGREPPKDEESIGEVEQALREVHTTRFLLEAARGPEWLRWLSGRKHLDALFDNAELGEKGELFANWLAQHFAIENPNDLFEIIAAHGLRMHPSLWWSLGRELGLSKEKSLDESALKRWVTILLTSIPAHGADHVLMWLAERCAAHGLVELTLNVFLAMSEHRLSLKPGFVWPDDDSQSPPSRLDAECLLRSEHWPLNEVWANHLKPHQGRVVQSLLSGIKQRLEEMHNELLAWDRASRDWDPISYRRSAIEPNKNDQYPDSDSINVLIDAARDALEWLAANSPVLLDAWIEVLVSTEIPLLRRFAIHAISAHPGHSSDDRLIWLLDRLGIHQSAEQHEVHRVVELNYSTATDVVRKAIVDAILTHQLPASGDWSAERLTARTHYDWLSLLLQVKPDCTFAGAALEQLKEQYGEWVPSNHPDFTSSRGALTVTMGSESPFTVEQLHARLPSDQLDDLLSFKGVQFNGPSREGLLANVREACKQRVNWGLELARALSDRCEWAADLWAALLQGMKDAEPTTGEWRELLGLISNSELQSVHARDVANLIYALVRDGGKPFVLDLLEEANTIAFPLWQTLQVHAEDEVIDDWLSRAINRPAGVIVEFWMEGLSLLLRGRTGAERVLPEDYREWFTRVALEASSKGGMGRSLLASQTAFLFGLDEAWTREYVIPLFSDQDDKKFAQAWDGFLTWGRLNEPALVEAMMPAFLSVLPRYFSDAYDRRKRLIEFYTALAVFHVPDPVEELLPTLFKDGTLEDRVAFAAHVGRFLRQMNQPAMQELWDGWLHRYWLGRLQGTPAALEDGEIRQMLNWLPHFGDAFPDAADLAVRFHSIRIDHCHTLFELRESDLVNRFPAETARLLIYFSNCDLGYNKVDLATVGARLPQIPSDLRGTLDEAFARAGVPKLGENSQRG